MPDMIQWACMTFVRAAFGKYQSDTRLDGPWLDEFMVTVRPTSRGHVRLSVCQGMLSATCLWPTRAADGERIVWEWRNEKPVIAAWERV